jgi:hypothetical protein
MCTSFRPRCCRPPAAAREVTRHRAGGGQVLHNEFTFTELVDERVFEIREGRPNATHKDLQARAPCGQAWRQGQVLDKALGYHLIDYLKATFVEDLEWDAAHGRLILVRHRYLPAEWSQRSVA